ncbi:hypothetical protein CHARACLAT_000744 [Characodon lateralis]|uniref:Uncharacterized protein n=1 Tax=Characodon lateralis TaxID=208331 RepID=A0ABU7DCH0_9TELE|nr:hypothetical protein [Characodon lateralis]
MNRLGPRSVPYGFSTRWRWRGRLVAAERRVRLTSWVWFGWCEQNKEPRVDLHKSPLGLAAGERTADFLEEAQREGSRAPGRMGQGESG